MSCRQSTSSGDHDCCAVLVHLVCTDAPVMQILKFMKGCLKHYWKVYIFFMTYIRLCITTFEVLKSIVYKGKQSKTVLNKYVGDCDVRGQQEMDWRKWYYGLWIYILASL